MYLQRLRSYINCQTSFVFLLVKESYRSNRVMYEALIIVRRLYSHFTVQRARNNGWNTAEFVGGNL